MAYNSIIDRTGASALMPEEVSREILQNVENESAVMRLARRLPNMSRTQRRLPVLSALVSAYFIDGDTGKIETSEASWANKYIDAERLAVIVPIPRTVLDDADYDIWAEIRPLIDGAFGKAFDQAVLYGTNAPSSWPSDVVTAATAASNAVTLGAGTDLYDDIMDDGGVLSTIEADGYAVNGHVGALVLKAKLRGLRDDNGQPIFTRSMQAPNQYMLDGELIEFPRTGAVDATSSLLISGDWDQLVWATRTDITYSVHTEGVIQDAAGNIVYNLLQQELVALKAVMRLGWQVPNPINRVQETEASRYPFGILLPT